MHIYNAAAHHVVYGGGNVRAMKSIQTAGGASLMSLVPAADHGIQQGIPTAAAAGYNVYAG